MDTQTILKYVMNSPENTNPNVLKCMLDQLSENGGSGGGGSSDFSTATVTLTNPSQGGGTVEFEQSVYISSGSMVGGGGGFSNIESSIPFVLYKGAGFANFPLKQDFTVTGDIEYDPVYGDLIIRGDGTITIKPIK